MIARIRVRKGTAGLPAASGTAGESSRSPTCGPRNATRLSSPLPRNSPPISPTLQFQIVGDGPRRAELEALVRARGLERTVVFLGHREDVSDLLGAADVFVLPSKSEAFPNGAIEAMAAGLPVVASAVGGLLDLIEPERTGMLVQPGTPTRSQPRYDSCSQTRSWPDTGRRGADTGAAALLVRAHGRIVRRALYGGPGGPALSGAHRAQAAGI